MGEPASPLQATAATPAGPDPARIHAHLQALIRSVDGINTAVVASVDGFVQAQVVRQAGTGERLAAMTSSMLALAGAIGRELALGELQVLMVEASEGKVLMLSIPVPGRPLLLMAACTQRSVIGNALWSARQCGQQILSEFRDA